MRILAIVLVGLGVTFYGCQPRHTPPATGNNPANPEAQAAPMTSTATPAAAVNIKTTYTCPMHPEVVSDQPGKCPKCGMALVPVKAKKP